MTTKPQRIPKDHLEKIVLANIAELIIIGRSRTNLDLLPGFPCRFVAVSPHYYRDYVGFARWFYRGKPFPLYQIVWPNNDGLYQWSPHAPDSFKEWQPALGEVPKGV